MTIHANQSRLPHATWRAIGACATVVLLLAQSNAAMSKPTREVIIIADQEYENADGFRRTVRFKDLDLNSPDGIRMLNRRVWATARSGCNRLYRSEGTMSSFHERNACTRIAVADAKPQVERVTQLAMAGDPASTQVAVVGSR